MLSVNSLSDLPTFTLINVPGVCHGPEKHAVSLIHRWVSERLTVIGVGCKTVFIPSADVRIPEGSHELVGLQLPPSHQLTLLQDVAEEAKAESNISIALAHSLGSIVAMRALQDEVLDYAVFISPTFLDPRTEIFESTVFKRRLQPAILDNGEPCMMISPAKMSYSTLFPNSHFDDPLYRDPIVSRPEEITKMADLIKLRAKILLGEYDWNTFKDKYPEHFQVDIIPEEKHSFENNPKSVTIVVDAILDLVKK